MATHMHEDNSLGQALHDTIANLEEIRDSQEPTPEIFERLDQLYAQQIELIDAAIRRASTEYDSATKAMNDAAKATEKAIRKVGALEDSLNKVGEAISKVAVLLAAIAAW